MISNQLPESLQENPNLDQWIGFEAGGTVEAWRGKHMVQVDRRKEGARKACRRPPADD